MERQTGGRMGTTLMRPHREGCIKKTAMQRTLAKEENNE